ncbi:DUF4291 domain-containing protein [Undibacterium sp. TC4M20W]|uniref:DUF4291 domain-containing protein n=1 Tax=Undibacterium sp. TC4M20W TaxID=3413052 RepID=UPI003BF1666B
MKFEAYRNQVKQWPENGKHIMAQFDEDTIIVYQAYSDAIADFAIEHQYFGGAYSYTRMSWIKPNFLWMMFRSGWAQKPGQERVLAIRIKRSFFDEILSQAIPSSFAASEFATQEVWKQAIETSDVRLQWDPDHDPAGNCLPRRALQLGLRGEMLARYGKKEILEIIDVTPFVLQQLPHVDQQEQLLMPVESIYRSCV